MSNNVRRKEIVSRLSFLSRGGESDRLAQSLGL